MHDATFQLSHALAKWSDQLARDGKIAAIDAAEKPVSSDQRCGSSVSPWPAIGLAERWHQAVQALKRVRKLQAILPRQTLN